MGANRQFQGKTPKYERTIAIAVAIAASCTFETNIGSAVCVAVYWFKNYTEDRSTHNRLAERRIHFMIKMAAGSHIGFELGDLRLYTKPVSAWSSNLVLIRFIVSQILRF